MGIIKMSSGTMEQLEQQVVASVDGQLQTPVMTHTGQVKWFNNKLCYGFIRVVSEGDSHGEDIFVHQKNITPNVSEWRILRLGEYVSFQLSNEDGTKQAINVRGVNGGPLMVDELLKSRNERRDHAVANSDGSSPNNGRQRRPRNDRRQNDNSSAGATSTAPHTSN